MTRYIMPSQKFLHTPMQLQQPGLLNIRDRKHCRGGLSRSGTAFRHLEESDAVDIPDAPSSSLGKVLAARRSVREFGGGSLPDYVIAALLRPYFVRQESRPGVYVSEVPSAGALHGLEIAAATLDEGYVVEAWARTPNLNMITKIKDFKKTSMNVISTNPLALTNASHLVFIFGNYGRTRIKYGLRTLRLLHIEAGCCVMAMQLLAVEMGIGCYISTEFYDNSVEQMFGVDGNNISLITTLVLGKMKGGESNVPGDRYPTNGR